MRVTVEALLNFVLECINQMGCGHNSVVELFPSMHRSQIKFPAQNKQTKANPKLSLPPSTPTLNVVSIKLVHSSSMCCRRPGSTQSSVQVITQELQLNFVSPAFLDMSLCGCQASLQDLGDTEFLEMHGQIFATTENTFFTHWIINVLEFWGRGTCRPW